VDLEPVSAKHLNELEQLVTQLLATMRKAKLTGDPIYTSLQAMEQTLGQSRRDRFDENHAEYVGY
jgi:beta-galactosidase beta subunit